jgi:hypothetical protein
MTDKLRERAKEILNALAKEHGSETFVSDGYAYYDEALHALADALRATRAEAIEECAKVAEDHGREAEHTCGDDTHMALVVRSWLFEASNAIRALADQGDGA